MRYLTIMLLAALSAISLRGEQSIVPSQIADNPDYRLVADFLSHYQRLLHSPMTQEVSDRIRRVREDGFRYIKGSDTAFRGVSAADDFSIGFDRDGYRVSWWRGGECVVECAFPARIELLSLSDKIDLEKSFIERLETAANSQTPTAIPTEYTDSLSKVSCSDLYLKDAGYYITPRLSNQVVYTVSPVDSTRCTLLIDTDRYQLESVANVMLTGYAPYPLEANVRVSQYGYKSTTVRVRFSTLFDLLSGGNTTPYWGGGDV